MHRMTPKPDANPAESKSNRPPKATPPARKTIHNEIVTLRQVLKTAIRHGWLTGLPELSPPYKTQGKIVHRPWFTADGYLFHFNDIPVYEAKALIQGTLVMAEETFQKVRFRQFDNGYPVDVTYQIDPNDPWHGTLMYEWQRDVELGNEKVYFITYPQSSSEE